MSLKNSIFLCCLFYALFALNVTTDLEAQTTGPGAQEVEIPQRGERIKRADEVTLPWIAVSRPASEKDDPSGEVLAGVIADNLELTLHLTGGYVVRPRPEGADSVAGVNEAAELAETERIDYVVFGLVERREDSSTLFTLSVYSRESGEVVLERRAAAPTLFDTFNVADRLTAEVLEAFTGQRIAYGTLRLNNLADNPGEYEVYLDGAPAGRNLPVVERVLVGSRLVEVVAMEGPASGRAVAAMQTTVTEGAREELSFYLAAHEPEPEIAGEPAPDAEPDTELDPAPEAEIEPEIALAEEAEPEPDPTLESDPPPDILPDEPERSAAAETAPREVPLEYRVYRWNRADRPGQRTHTFTFSTPIGSFMRREKRYEAYNWAVDFMSRTDWGNNHSLFFGYSIFQADDVIFTENYVAPSSIPDGQALKYASTSVNRLTLGYGRGFGLLRRIMLIPGLWIGLEAEEHLVGLENEDGQWQGFEDTGGRSPYAPNRTEMELFWNFLAGAGMAVEGALGPFSLTARTGFYRVFPFTREYSTEVSFYNSDLDQWFTFPVEGTLDAVWSWHTVVGVGYSLGGNEAEINADLSEPRPYKKYHPDERRGWGLSAGTAVGYSHVFVPGIHNTIFIWPPTEAAFEYAAKTGATFDARLFILPPRVREYSALSYGGGFSEEEHAISQVVLAPYFDLGYARRLLLSEQFSIKAGYSLGGGPRMGLASGPVVSLEHSFPGSSAMMFGKFWLISALPAGQKYSGSLFENYHGSTMDVYATSPPILNASLGVRFHLAGTPARMFAQPDGGNRSGALASAALPTADAEREWWKPRLSLGTGVETHYLPGENGTYSGFLTVFPAALRFPFGGEVVFQASMPLGWTGIVGERGAYEISDYEFEESSQGEYIDPFYATPRLNRVTSVEAGYRLRRDEWLSLRPAVRYTWADLELWDIAANIFYDGSERELKAGEEHFARADPARWLGPSFELTLQLGRRFTLRAVGAALLPITRGETRVKPVLAPEVLVEYPGTLYSGSLSITAGL